MSFVHLHVHSCFSFLDGAARVEDLVARAVELGLPALALTDHNGLYGAVRFYKAACSASIKPLLGSEIDVQGGHLLLLAKDKEGYSNLCRLLTILHLSRNGGSPALELDHLSAHSSGLICLSGCEKGEVPSLLRAGKVKAALEAASRLKDIFGDHFFVELQNHLLPHSSSLNYHLSQLAHHLGLPLVATNNVHYLKAEDYPLHELLISIRKIERVGQSKPPRLNAEYYLKSPAQMQRLFRNYPQALANSLLLPQECSLELELKKPRLPHFELARGEEPFGYLCRLCWQQAQEIYGSISSELKGRLEKELKAVKELGLASYFLIVWDLVSFAQKRGISYSGRGSAAGSLICYLLGITKVDPLAQGLLFERFLNENRKELPDIDVDFSSARREVVLTYLYQKYGKEQVAMVATLITYRAKNALRDVGKTLGLDKESLDHLAKALPYISAERIPQAVESLPELDPKEFSSPKVRQAVALAGRLSGFPRHLGTHLGGVVISPEPLTDIVPLERNAQGLVVCQMDKDDLQELGLLKLDVLGLRMLASLEEAGEWVEKRWGLSLELEDLPLDDPQVYKLLRSSHTVGVFQLESPGMRELLSRLKPTCFSDVVANLSLFRPGPVQADMVSPFVKRRQGKERATYLDPELKAILEETYGVPLFQEQIMRILSHFGGVSLAQADSWRRALDRTKPQEIKRVRQEFLKAAQGKGYPQLKAGRIFDELVLVMAAYGFCKSHAASFAEIAYRSAWLKRYAPAEFFCGLLNHCPGMYPLRVLLNEAKRWAIPVLPPDVNTSSENFTLEQQAIRVGLSSVKHMSQRALHSILKARKEKKFSSFIDFYYRTHLDRRILENLIRVGALDNLERNRKYLLWLLFVLRRRPRQGGQLALELKDEQKELFVPFSLAERIQAELELLGFELSGHPLQLWQKSLKELGVIQSADLSQLPEGTMVRVAGIKVVQHTPPTRSGQRVIFLTLEDAQGLIDMAVFEPAQKDYARTIFEGWLLLVEGRIAKRGKASLVVSRAWNLLEMAEEELSLPKGERISPSLAQRWYHGGKR